MPRIIFMVWVVIFYLIWVSAVTYAMQETFGVPALWDILAALYAFALLWLPLLVIWLKSSRRLALKQFDSVFGRVKQSRILQITLCIAVILAGGALAFFDAGQRTAPCHGTLKSYALEFGQQHRYPIPNLVVNCKSGVAISGLINIEATPYQAVMDEAIQEETQVTVYIDRHARFIGFEIGDHVLKDAAHIRARGATIASALMISGFAWLSALVGFMLVPPFKAVIIRIRNIRFGGFISAVKRKFKKTNRRQ